MYFVYSLDVNTYDLVVHSSYACIENAKKELDKLVKNFITHEQGAKYSTIWDSIDDFNKYSTIEKGYFLVKENNGIILYEKCEIVKEGYIYNSSEYEIRKLKIYNINEINYDVNIPLSEPVKPQNHIIRNIHYDGLISELKKNKKFKARKID